MSNNACNFDALNVERLRAEFERDDEKGLHRTSSDMSFYTERGNVIVNGRYLTDVERILWVPFFDWEFRDHKDFIVQARRNDPKYRNYKSPEPPEVQELMDRLRKGPDLDDREIFGCLRDCFRRNRCSLKRCLWFPPVDAQFEAHKDFIVEARRNDPNFFSSAFTPEPKEVQELLDCEYLDRLTPLDFRATRVFLYQYANSLGGPRCLWDPEFDAGLEEHKDFIIEARRVYLFYDGPGSDTPESSEVQAIIDKVRQCNTKPKLQDRSAESSNPLRALLSGTK